MKIAVRTPNWIGDCILSLPALESLRRSHPRDEIWLLAQEWVSDIFSDSPLIDGILVLPKRQSLTTLRSAVQEVKRQSFDAGLLLTNSFGSALLLALSRVPERWGYARDGRGALLTRRVKPAEDPSERHQVHYYLRLLQGLGIKTLPPVLRLSLTAEEQREARRRLDALKLDRKRPLVILNPGASYGPAKRWPVPCFAQAAAVLQKKYKAQILVIGAAGETMLGSSLAEKMERKPIILSGQTTLRQLLGLLSHARLFITNDSGPMHMANALSVPVVALFGPTQADVTGPFQGPATVLWKKASCGPCTYRACPYDHHCMTAITPDEVVEAAGRYLR